MSEVNKKNDNDVVCIQHDRMDLIKVLSIMCSHEPKLHQEAFFRFREALSKALDPDHEESKKRLEAYHQRLIDYQNAEKRSKKGLDRWYH